MRIRHSLLAKLLVLMLCFALVLAGCNSTKEGPEDAAKNEGTTNTEPKTPEAHLTSAAKKTLGAMLSDCSSENVLDDVFTKGKITIEAMGMVENILYIDAANSYFADELTIGAGGQKIEASIFADDSALAVMLPAILGDGAYGIDFTTLMQDLESSAIWEVTGLSYEELIQSSAMGQAASAGSIIKMLDRIGSLEKAIKAASANVTFTSAAGKTSIYGEEVDATLITVHLTSDDMEAMVLAYLGWLEEVMKEEMADQQIDESLTDIFDEYENQIKEGFDGFDVVLDAVVAIDPATDYMMSFDLDLEGKIEGEDGRAIRMDLILGKDPANSDKYTFTMSAEDDGEVVGGAEAVLSWSTASNVDTTELKITATEDGETNEVFYGALNYDNSDKTYSLLAQADGSEVKLEGKFEHTEKLFDLTVDTLTIDGMTQMLDLRISAEGVDEVPQMPQYENILQMSEDELSALLGRFGLVG